MALPLMGQDVAAIFTANCAACHSARAKMGGFVMEAPGGFAKVVVPGNSAESKLFRMITGQVKPQMPLGGRPLAAGEIEAVKKWIDGGAPPLALAFTPAIPDIKPKHAVKAAIGSLAWSPDGKLIALGGYKEVRLVDAAGKPAAVLAGHADEVRALAFSRDGKLLAAAGGKPAQGGEVKIWDVESRQLLRTFTGHADCIYAAAFSPDGKSIATSSYDKLIKLWDAASGQEVRTFKDHIDAVYALAFTPDGAHLVSGAADRSVKVWNVSTGERLYTLSEPADGLNTVALSPTGTLVAAGGLDKTIRIWSLGEKGGKLLNSLIAHEDAILRLAWSPDGKLLVSSGADRALKVFRASDLSEVKVFAAQPDWVMSLDFAPDGAHFAVGRFDGSLEIYPTPGLPGKAAATVAAR
jgi:WD40 repeat protein